MVKREKENLWDDGTPDIANLKAGMLVFVVDRWLRLDEVDVGYDIHHGEQTQFWYATDSDGNEHEVYPFEIEEVVHGYEVH